MSFKKTNNLIKSLTPEQRYTRRRVLEISYKLQLSHLGSCLSAIDLIDAVYKVKKEKDKFILSNGHAGVAWYVILEKYGFIKDPKVLEKLYVHPDRNIDLGIEVSSGSLGQGLPIALGMALAAKDRDVYCMLSDGECTEGSIWEALRIAGDKKVKNLKVIVNANGWGAYDGISSYPLIVRIKSFNFSVVVVDGHDIEQIKNVLTREISVKPLVVFAKTTVGQLPFLKDQDAHYYVMSDKDYLLALDLILWS